MPKDVFPNYPRTGDHLPDGDPVGRSEMARFTGKSVGAVRKWVERYLLPPADGPIVDGLPTWKRRTFLAWALKAGHLEDPYTGKRAELWEEAVMWSERVPSSRLRSVRELREAGVDLDVVGWESDR